jgi:hypothetical protein
VNDEGNMVVVVTMVTVFERKCMVEQGSVRRVRRRRMLILMAMIDE